MKHAVRISGLMFGLVGTYVAAAVPQVPAPDGDPLKGHKLQVEVERLLVKHRTKQTNANNIVHFPGKASRLAVA